VKKKKLQKKLTKTREKLVKVESIVTELESKLAKKAEPPSIGGPSTKTQQTIRKTPPQQKKTTTAVDPTKPQVKTIPVRRREGGK